MKIQQLIFITIMLMIGFSGISQEDVDWRAWVVNTDGQLVQINSEGQTLREIMLTQGREILRQVVIAPNGELAATIITRRTSPIPRLYLHEVREDERTLISGSAPSIESALHFSSNGDRIAYVAGQGIQVIDTHKQEVVVALETTLFSDDLEATPEILYFGDGQLWFRVGDSALRWDLRSGQVIASDLIPTVPSDGFAPTGELLFVTTNPDQSDYGAVSVLDSLIGGRFPFYINTTAVPVMGGVHFVQNGQRILYHGQSDDADLWLLLERDGQIVRPLRNIKRHSLYGTINGFIYVLRSEGRSEVIAFDVDQPFSDRSIWQAEGDWSIVWAETDASSFGPFKPWRFLADPISDPALPVVESTPTPLPSPPQLLNPGMAVYVITNGDVLYLRDEPGTGGAILQYLYDRDVVTLLEGPVAADGFRWWRIRTEDGVEGWAAEASGDVSTLLPELPPPPRITPTATP